MVRISENVTAQYDLILLYINGKVQLGWCFFSFFFLSFLLFLRLYLLFPCCIIFGLSLQFFTLFQGKKNFAS